MTPKSTKKNHSSSFLFTHFMVRYDPGFLVRKILLGASGSRGDSSKIVKELKLQGPEIE